MVSVKHRLLELYFRLNSPDLKVVDPDEFRALRIQRQGEVPTGPPPGIEDRIALSRWNEDTMRVDVLAPRDRAPTRTLFYLHGGGYVSKAVRQHWRYAESLVAALDARVVVPDYPIAPEHCWRDAHPRVLAAFRRVAAEGGDLTLIGDSAGAGFAVALAQKVVTDGDRRPDRLVVSAAWMDLSMKTGVPPRDPMLNVDFLRRCGELWADGDDPTLPQLSPINGTFEGLPPILSMCGTKDVQLPQARALAKLAEAAGVSVTYIEERGLMHDYPILNIPEARRALGQVASYVRGE
jgi:monoterpene epsilon-lactone hydrolase